MGSVVCFVKLVGVRWVRLTMRAADGGWAARFLAFLVALSFFHFDGKSQPTPTAANACRWANSLELGNHN